jgi:ferredoxin
MLVLLPALVAIGAWMGRRMGVPLSYMHPEVRLADRIRLEETGKVAGTIDASDAFRRTGRRIDDLYRSAMELIERFTLAGTLWGAWIGLVIGAKLVHLSVRRRRTDYQPDRANCVSCGRCFWYCPIEQVRLGLMENVEAAIKPSGSNRPEASGAGEVCHLSVHHQKPRID